MMIKIKTVAALLCFLCVSLSLMCAKGIKDDNNYRPLNIAEVDPKELQSPYEEADLAAKIAASGANDFAFRLSASLLEKSNGNNFVCSPYSVWLPLAALTNAATPQAKAALFSALGASGITEADINRAASRMLYDLTKLQSKQYSEYFEYHNPLKIANAVFVGNDVTLRKSFAQIFMDFYRGNSIQVDFSSHSAVDAVNKWASDNTEGLITNVVQEFDPLTVAAIANAIYFSDRWTWEFDPAGTKEDVFHSPKEDETAFYMLREGSNQVYYEDDRVQAMPLIFKKGGGMCIILPKTGGAPKCAEELLASMNSEYFNEIQAKSVRATGKLLLPRFSIENDIKDLKDVLISLGVPLFDKESAPLTGGLIEENVPMWLSDAMQKAIINVDEKGTTAAAVTVLAASALSAPLPTLPFEMICNRPFVFILYERTYDGGNQILFTGLVNKP